MKNARLPRTNTNPVCNPNFLAELPTTHIMYCSQQYHSTKKKHLQQKQKTAQRNVVHEENGGQ